MATVLIAGHSAVQRQTIAQTLQDSGYKVAHAATACETWGQLLDTAIDVLVLAGGLDTLDPTALVAAVRNNRFLQRLPIIAVDERPTQDPQIQGWLPREYLPDDLLDLLVVLLPRPMGGRQR
ncbi:MAG: hypothetical protein H7338_09850 [Candidatus Sericytochromatia bacterium]|nr:hypothetical protein [Candidatus Sericytochromatia bacterium]